MGASFLAFSTSLPELATAVAAVRIGAFDLAVGSLLGSNAFNMAIILIVDLFYTEGPILADVHPIEAFVGVSAILLMAIVVAGIIHGAKTRASRLEPGSGMTLVAYFVLMYMIFTAGPERSGMRASRPSTPGTPSTPTPMTPAEELQPWRVEAAEVASALDTGTEAGLGADAAAARLTEYGPNELVEKKQRPTWMLFVDQFTSPMILVLIAAAVITAVIGHTKDTVVILAIVVFNGVVGFVQEYRAGQAMDALKRMSSPDARVVRDGEIRLVPAAEVVPGDVVLLEQGDIVTADMRLVEAPGARRSTRRR